MYTEQNPHPDLKYIETRENGIVWFQCKKCGQYMNGVHHFGWRWTN
jgi:hypothetical protein